MINSSDICIILTSTINVKEQKVGLFQKDKEKRLITYLKAIRQWIEKTNFRLVLVENSGYLWPELNQYVEQYADRLIICSFNEELEQGADYLRLDQSKGCSEMFAIDYAYRNCDIVSSSKFILKITARYFIPELEEFLQNVPLEKCAALRQNDENRCELVGCSPSFFDKVFYKYSLDKDGNRQGHVENVYKYRINLIKSEKNLILICKEFAIEPTIRGGVNRKYTNI